MKKLPVLLLDADDGSKAELVGRLRAYGFTVAEDSRAWAAPGSAVVLVVPAGGSSEATCSRVLRWCATQRPEGTVTRTEPRADLGRLVGASAGMEAVRRAIGRIAASDANVLVTGETGTGKELVAELIHLNSGRTGPLVPINCAAIPDGLLESELFGYERGAFTGASGSYEGKLRLAHGGTVLLDEIGDMSPYAQAKLLRAIETREVYRLGGRRPVPLDVRIVAATNAELEGLVAEGRFRRDLYFRLNVARVHIPPLRERAGDVPALLDHALAGQGRPGRRTRGFSVEALECLGRYPWPGNVRELRNVVEVMALGSEGVDFGLEDIPSAVRENALSERSGPRPEDPDAERERLLAALRTTRWNKSRAAQQLRWSRMTVYRKIAKYQISETGAGDLSGSSSGAPPPSAGRTRL